MLTISRQAQRNRLKAQWPLAIIGAETMVRIWCSTVPKVWECSTDRKFSTSSTSVSPRDSADSQHTRLWVRRSDSRPACYRSIAGGTKNATEIPVSAQPAAPEGSGINPSPAHKINKPPHRA